MHSGQQSILALLIALAPLAARADAPPSCEQSVKTASERLVFAGKDGKKYYLATEVKGAEAADPARLCAKSNAAALEKKLCQTTFTAIRKASQEYLRELGTLCREISRRAPVCSGPNHQACAQRANQQGLDGQAKMLGLLKKFDTKKLDEALKGVEGEYKKFHEGLFRLFQQADKDNKLADLKAQAQKPALPPAQGSVSARSVGAANLEQAWALVSGKPLPTKASTITIPEGALVKELQTVKAMRDHLLKGFIEPETADRKKSTTELASLHKETGGNAGRGSSLTGVGGSQQPGTPRPGQGAPTSPGLDQAFALAQQGLGAAGNAMKGAQSSASPTQGLPGTQTASLHPPAYQPTTSSQSSGTTPSAPTTYRDVGVLSHTGGGSLIAASGSTLNGASTGAIRRLPGGLVATQSARGARGAADNSAPTSDALASAVKEAITASQGLSKGGDAPGAEATGATASAEPAKSGESLADLFARFDRAATKMKETFEKSPIDSIANLFSGGSSDPAPSGSTRASSPAAPAAVQPLEGARIAQAAKPAPKRAPASLPVADYFTEPTSDDLDDTELAAGITIEEETLFRRVHLKLQEKAGQIPVSQL